MCSTGGKKHISASERWRRKKAGQEDSGQGSQQQVTELTELANRLLTKTGNMDIYQESYEHIASLVGIVRPCLVLEQLFSVTACELDVNLIFFITYFVAVCHCTVLFHHAVATACSVLHT
jgi:hypothetical protein